MKNKIYLTTLLLALVFSSFAQTEQLCHGFPSLIYESKNGFRNIMGEKLDESGSHIGTNYNSTLNIEGSSKNYITIFGNNVFFTTQFGNFATQDEVDQKLNSIKTDFIACQPEFEFFEGKKVLFNTPVYYFIQNLRDGFRVYNVELTTEQNDDLSYYVRIVFRPNNNPLHYQKITSGDDKDITSNEISKLLNEAKSSFKSIKGEIIENPFSPDVQYFTTFCLTGCKDCWLTLKETKLYFKAIIVENVSENDFNSALDKLVKETDDALGSDYAFIKDERTHNMKFAKITDAASGQFCVLEILKEKGTGDDKFNLVLKVNENFSLE